MATDKTFEKVQIYFNFNKEVTGSTKLADSVLYSNLDPTGSTNMAVEMAKIYSWANDVFTFTPTGTNKITIKSSVLPADSDTTYSFQEGNVAGAFQVKENNDAWQTIAIHSVPTLDANGKILKTYLPSYVDDVIEGYYYNGKFYKEAAHTTEITPEGGKIYVDLTSNDSYRWGGTTYVKISNPTDVFTGATADAAGTAGLVPAPQIADRTKFLKGDGTWASVVTVDEKVKNTYGTANTYYPAGMTQSSTTTTTQVADTSFKFVGSTGTTSAVGKAELTLGNATASGAAGNKQGSLVIYGSTAYKHTISGAPTADRTLTLPNKAGTIALTSDLPTVNNGKLTIKGGTTSVTEFTANQSGDISFSIVAGTNISVTPDATNHKVTIANTYTHPSHTAKTSGLYKITVDSSGHVSAATAVAKSDITALGIPGQDTWVAMTAATASAAGTRGTVQPPANSMDKYLRGDNTWVNPIDDIGILTLHCTNGTS